jgi:N-methylhydantoinase B
VSETLVALVVPRGFADLLALARQNREDLYSARPLLARAVMPPPAAWCFEIQGRIDAAGREVQALDEMEIVATAQRIASTGAAAVAVCGLFAHLNPRQEQRVAELLRPRLPGLKVVMSHAVEPNPREYERFAATLRAAIGAGASAAPESPEPPKPPLDDATTVSLHPIDALDRLAGALQAITDRMQQRLMQGARSSIAREAGDCAAALFLPDGRLIAQARWLPLLLGSLIHAVAAVIAKFPPARMAEGDAYLLNDPWDGGSHLPDLTLVVPIFGRTVGQAGVQVFAAVSLHHQDVGGLTPGSVPPHATSIFEEGLRVPAVQSFRAGTIDPTVRALLLANTRTPAHLEADLEAQWACAQLAARELQPLLAHPAFVAEARALLERTERATRAALAAAPDGRYGWTDQLDSDGVDDAPVTLNAMLVKRGDTLRIDFTGSAAQTRGPANASPASMMSAALYFMRTLAPAAPNNGGCLAPMTLVLPEGSVVHPRFPAPVNARTATVKLAANALLSAWGHEAAAVTAAAHAGVAAVLSLGGEDAVGKPFHFTEIIASGAGASAHGPGESGVSTDVGNARNTPIEIIEAQAPVRVEAYEIRRGSGGEGAFRGGDGVRRAYRLLQGRAVLTYRGERHTSRAAGCAGGGPGASSAARVLRADGRIETLGSRARVALNAGDGWIIETAGGGGWGPAEAVQAAIDEERRQRGENA